MPLPRFSIEGGVQDGPHRNDTELQNGRIAGLQNCGEATRDEVATLAADRAFNQAMADRDAVATVWAPFFAPNGPTIRWLVIGDWWSVRDSASL